MGVWVDGPDKGLPEWLEGLAEEHEGKGPEGLRRESQGSLECLGRRTDRETYGISPYSARLCSLSGPLTKKKLLFPNWNVGAVVVIVVFVIVMNILSFC